MRFLLVPHRDRSGAALLARDTIDWLVGRGHDALVLDDDAGAAGLAEWAVSSVDGAKIDLAVALGGDGTMLRALDLMCADEVPVLGVNFGHLGYLTEIEPADTRMALDRFVAGDYVVEERMTLDVSVRHRPESGEDVSSTVIERSTAVNEVVVQKTSSGQTVRLEASINGRPFLTYAVDGMIVATPTGSTAYSLSARGPILSPTLRALLMTPVSPHMLFDRALVLDGDEHLELRVLGATAAIVVDGRHVGLLGREGVVTCRQSSHAARIVTFGPRDFHSVLKAKFGLADR